MSIKHEMVIGLGLAGVAAFVLYRIQQPTADTSLADTGPTLLDAGALPTVDTIPTNTAPNIIYTGETTPAPSIIDSTLTFIGGLMPFQISANLPKNTKYVDALKQAELKYGLPQNLLVAQAYTESRFNPDAVSPVGAKGIMQFMPATAKDYKINPLDPFASIDAAGKYMASLFKSTGNWLDALAAYNWGIGNVKKKGVAAAPKETRDYVAQISSNAGLS